ncbi:MAG: hypothetical protein ACLFQV_11885, partial [Vulcanimicrobiota bacterium]
MTAKEILKNIEKCREQACRLGLNKRELSVLFYIILQADWENGLSTGIISDEEIEAKTFIRRDKVKTARDNLVDMNIIRAEGRGIVHNYILISPEEWKMDSKKDENSGLDEIPKRGWEPQNGVDTPKTGLGTPKRGWEPQNGAENPKLGEQISKEEIPPGTPLRRKYILYPCCCYLDIISLLSAKIRNLSYLDPGLAAGKMHWMGVSKEKARALVDKHGPLNCWIHILRHRWYLRELREPANPPGVLISAIERGWSEPKSLQKAWKRRARALAVKKAEEITLRSANEKTRLSELLLDSIPANMQ